MEDASPADILLVVVDTLRADHVGIYGHERATTPNMDTLARRGTWFRRAYAHSGWTLPSFTSLLTGLLPHEHRVGRDPVNKEQFGRLSQEADTLAELLSKKRYRCGAIVNNTFLAPEFGLNQGFGSGYDYEGATKGEIRSADDSVDRALSWIRSGDGPYFLLLHFMEPHLYYDPPKSVRGTFTGDGPPLVEVPFASDDLINALMGGDDRLTGEELDYVEKLYDEEILAADQALGRLIHALSKGPRWAQTVCVVTADHGEEFFDHGRFEHGHTLYGELTRIPLIASGPGIDQGEIETVVQHADLFQGICSLAGAVPPKGTRGEDLFALAREGRYAGPRTSISENVLYGPDRVSLVDGDFRLIFHFEKQLLEVWELDEQGLERSLLEKGESQDRVRRLLDILRRERGGLEPVKAASGPKIPGMEVFMKLRDLGYVGGK